MKPRKHADLSWACGLAVALVAVTLAGPGIWAAVPAMLVIGEMTRNRRDYLRAVEQRAAEAERTREEAALRRAGGGFRVRAEFPV